MNRRSFLGLFAKMVALAVPTALLRSAPVAAAVPLPEDFVFWTPEWPFWLENNPAWLAGHLHDAGAIVLRRRSNWWERIRRDRPKPYQTFVFPTVP